MTNKDNLMLEFYKTNLENATDPLDKASYKRLIAKYEKKLKESK